jgi:hypothetical protein
MSQRMNVMSSTLRCGAVRAAFDVHGTTAVSGAQPAYPHLDGGGGPTECFRDDIATGQLFPPPTAALT